MGASSLTFITLARLPGSCSHSLIGTEIAGIAYH
jgi:hypothetical protein